MALTKHEAELLLEAFINWMDTDSSQWNEKGEAANLDYRRIIHKLERYIQGRG